MSSAPEGETLGSLLYPGFQTSIGCLQPMVQQTEQLLRLKDHQVPHVIWRLDAGFGTDAAIKWLLARDYQLLTKGYNSRRADKVVTLVPSESWHSVRANKWATETPTVVRYGRRVQTIALRWLTEKGRERHALLLHTLFDQSLLQVLADYDARGGTLEKDIKQDKLGLQLIHRRKQRWYAQEAWVILTDIAHNLLIWLCDWMLTGSSFERYGMLRLVQDVLTIPGRLKFEGGQLREVSLQQIHPFAPEMQACLERLFEELSR